jgi:hypothetical protein
LVPSPPVEPDPDGAREAGGLARRLWMLSRLEAVNVALVPGCVIVTVLSLGGVVGPWTVLGLVACSLVLTEGALYWWARYDELVRRDRGRLEWTIVLLDRAQRLNVVVLAVAALAQGGWLLARRSIDQDGVLGGALLALAVLEHINYFHVQLMHDTRADLRRLWRARRLRRSHLARDLDRHRRR